jgi:hypothetical protein
MERHRRPLWPDVERYFDRFMRGFPAPRRLARAWSAEGWFPEIEKREDEKEVKEENYYCSERSSGEFSRTIRLPEGVSAGSVEASYTDGVLEVSVPKPQQAETKTTKVPVK